MEFWADSLHIFGVIIWILLTIIGALFSIGMFMSAADYDDPPSGWIGLGLGIASIFSFSMMLAAIQ
jgi:hypothetical protein